MRLQKAIREYVSAKRSTGMSFKSKEKALRQFAKLAGPRLVVSSISSETVQSFLTSDGPSTTYWNFKYHTLNGFWQFAIQRGYADRSPLPMRSLKELRLFVPHIYSHDELKRLLDGVFHSCEPGMLWFDRDCLRLLIWKRLTSFPLGNQLDTTSKKHFVPLREILPRSSPT